MRIRNLAMAILVTSTALTTGFEAQASMSRSHAAPRVSGCQTPTAAALIRHTIRAAQAGAAGYRLVGISGIAAGIRHPELFASETEHAK